MKEFLETYEKNKENIEYFLQESLKNLGNLKNYEKDKFKKLFKLFPSLELIYIIDRNTNCQKSNNIYRKKEEEKGKGKNRSHLISKLHFKETNIAFSNPYISSATRNNIITVTLKIEEEIYFLDLKIDILLEKLNLLERNKNFHSLTKSFYLIVGGILMLLSLITILFSLYDFVSYLIKEHVLSLEMVFKPIISITLGIAIFDLAKTILEQEVFFKYDLKNTLVETNMLTKFLITIIIALSIEALIVVFKIAINNYDKMIHAFYLIVGIAVILISLTVFIRFTSKDSKKVKD